MRVLGVEQVSSTRPWTIREATLDDVPALGELHQTVFGSPRDAAFTRWKYFENPAGASHIMVADHDGLLIGQRALWAMPMRLGDTVVKGAQSVDSMTHPAYRRRGVFLELAAACDALAASRNVEVVFGFPNEQSLPPSIRYLNWHHIGNVRSYARPLSAEGISRVPRSLRLAVSLALKAWPRAKVDGFEVRPDRPTDDEFEQLLQHRRAGEGLCQVDHTPEWYDWRFSSTSGVRYEWIALRAANELRAYAVWRQSDDERSAMIAELVGVSAAATAAAVAAVADHARTIGCRSLELFSNRPEISAAIQMNGFRHIGQLPLKVRTLSARILGGNVHHYESWRVFGADFDVY